MFRSLRVKGQPEKIVPDSTGISPEQLERDPSVPITLRQINSLPDNAKKRDYRAILPPGWIARFGIDPISWKGSDLDGHIRLKAVSESGKVSVAAHKLVDDADDILFVELSDNAYNGIDLDLILINDPDGQRFRTDVDEQGQRMLFGTVRRNLTEEERAMQAGLAPSQVRASLRASQLVLDKKEAFLATLGHRADFLEPLTCASAWLFERRGFAYGRGHKLMDDIHVEFQPGERLHRALDGS